MAIFSYKEGFIKRSQGQSALAAAAYILRSSFQDHRTGVRYDFHHKGGLLHSRILVPSDAPECLVEAANDPEKFFLAIEAAEKRKDSQLAFNITAALPHELDKPNLIKLVEEFLSENFLQKGLAVCYAIHSPGPHSNSRNVHLHILATTRWIEANGFGKKLTSSWYKRARLKERRLNFELTNNHYLERQGLDVRIDARSYKDRGIERIPTRHMGPKVMALERRGVKTRLGDRLREIESLNNRRELEAQANNQVMVITPIGGEIALHEYLKSLTPPMPYPEISMKDMRNNPVLEREYWLTRKKKLQRDRAIAGILKDYLHKKKLSAMDLCALSHEDINELKNNGVGFLEKIQHEQCVARKRNTGRER